MQPEAFKETNTILSTSIFQENQQQPSHHGLDDDEYQLPSLLSSGEWQGVSAPRSSGAEAALAKVAVLNGALATPSRRLSTDSSSKGRSPVDRIAEYESAMSQPATKKDQGPKFKVVQMNQKPSNGNSAIAGFPNGQ